MKIDPSLFVGATGIITTLLISILGVLVGQVRWQAKTEARLDEQSRNHERVESRLNAVEDRVHAMETRGQR